MIRFCSPLIPDFFKVKAYMMNSFRTGQVSNFGPTYDKFVTRLKEFLDLSPDKEIVLTSSGHTALMAAYAVIGSMKFVIPSYTFESTRAAASLQKIPYEIVDVDLNSGCLTPECLEDLVHPFDTRTVVAVTALSTIPNLEALSNHCEKHNRTLIIDGAPSFGTSGIYNYGDVFCLSFHATKTLGIGEGGAVICSKESAEKIKRFINFGFDSEKNVSFSGMNAKISEYSCAIGLALLEDISKAINKRLFNASLYKEFLQSRCPKNFVRSTVYQSFPIYLEDSLQTQRVLQALKKNKIEAFRYYRPLTEHKNSVSLYERNICLPVHQDLTEQDIGRICKVVLDNL